MKVKKLNPSILENFAKRTNFGHRVSVLPQVKKDHHQTGSFLTLKGYLTKMSSLVPIGMTPFFASLTVTITQLSNLRCIALKTFNGKANPLSPLLPILASNTGFCCTFCTQENRFMLQADAQLARAPRVNYANTLALSPTLKHNETRMLC